jgi:hypothetical protein
MAENLTIHKIVTLLDSKGARHKNIPAKTTTARIFGNIVDAIGGERFITMAKSSLETDSKVISIIVILDHTQMHYTVFYHRFLFYSNSFYRIQIETL